MKQTHIDLRHKNKVNYLRITMGFILLAMVIYALYNVENFFKPMHLILFSAASLYYILMGFGLHPFTFWGKAYINISTDEIEIKPSILKPSTRLAWNNCEKVSITISSIRFSENNKGALEFDYQKMDTESVQELKQAIVSICKEKSIPLA